MGETYAWLCWPCGRWLSPCCTEGILLRKYQSGARHVNAGKMLARNRCNPPRRGSARLGARLELNGLALALALDRTDSGGWEKSSAESGLRPPNPRAPQRTCEAVFRTRPEPDSRRQRVNTLVDRLKRDSATDLLMQRKARRNRSVGRPVGARWSAVGTRNGG